MTNPSRPLRIFVVDDHRDVAEGLADVLRMHGHEVEVAFNGEQAIRVFREKDFDIAFMDVMMPGMNGVESFLEIRKIKPAARVIMMTGYSVEQLLDQAVENKAYGVLHKPVAIDDVMEALERVQSQGMVLVADDDPEFSATVKMVLEEHNYKVCLARTGSEALKTVLGGGVDILVLDLELPVISGLEVYMQLRRRGRAVPTVVVTGHSRDQAEAIGALRAVSTTGILTKPFDSAQLFEEIGKLVTKTPEAEPQAKTPEPQREPEPSWSAPEPRGEPEPSSSAPEPQREPEPSWSAPEPQSEPEPSWSAPEPQSEPEPSWSAPEPQGEPEPSWSAPEPRSEPKSWSAPEPRSAPKAQVTPAQPAPPTIQKEPAGRPAPANSAQMGPKKPGDAERFGRILAVDDDVDMVEGLAEVLRARGYTVETANNAEDAQAVIQNFDAQVALLDIRLGRSNGLELIPYLKECRPNIYCVMITGNADKESAITALRIGAYDYLTKPLHPNELFAILDRCLEKHDLERRLSNTFEALQNAKDQAEAASETGSGFLASLTEELGDPISAIISSSNLIVDEALGPVGTKQYREHAQSIRENASQIAQTLTCALELAKAQTGNLDIQEQEVDIANLMTAVAHSIRDVVEASTPEIEVNVPDNAPIVWGDEHHFKQILINLLSNAIKFTPEHGQIKLTLDRDAEGNMIIEVRDNGMGMAPAQIPNALSQFGRIQSQGAPKYSGAGLGLPLVAALAELHGGELHLDSELSKGTTARVTLPAQRVANRRSGEEPAMGSVA
jgi:DNA-binding NtrC family response regulator/two-component sensor histidine kinase